MIESILKRDFSDLERRDACACRSYGPDREAGLPQSEEARSFVSSPTSGQARSIRRIPLPSGLSFCSADVARARHARLHPVSACARAACRVRTLRVYSIASSCPHISVFRTPYPTLHVAAKDALFASRASRPVVGVRVNTSRRRRRRPGRSTRSGRRAADDARDHTLARNVVRVMRRPDPSHPVNDLCRRRLIVPGAPS